MPLLSLKTALRNALLPNGEATRHAWVMEKLSALPAAAKLLDVGAGRQPYRAACAHLAYHAQDFAAYTGKGDGTGLQDGIFPYGKLDYIGNAWSIDAPANSFDAILCTEVLEHIPHPRETILEIARLLAPGGTAIITAPVNCIPHQTPYFFSHGLARQFYVEAAQACNLRVAEFSTYSGTLDFLTQEIWRLMRHGPNSTRLPAMLALIPLAAARLLFGPAYGPPYPCFGSLVLLKK